MAEQSNLFNQAVKASVIAQSLFYTLIQNTWAYDLDNIRILRDHDGEIVAIEAIVGTGEQVESEGHSVLRRRAGGWLLDFPHDAFDPADEAIKHALLADQNSIWAFVVMHVVVEVLFEDLVTDVTRDIKEIVHPLPRHTRPLVQHRRRYGFTESIRRDTVYPDSDSNDYFKGIYSITLKDGMKVALDLAGAQYNTAHISLMPLPAYLSLSGKAVEYQVPFRFHYTEYMEKMSNYRNITHLTVVMELTAHFNTLVTWGEKLLSVNIEDLLALEAQALDTKLAQLIAEINAHLQTCSDNLDAGIHSIHSPQPFDLRHPDLAVRSSASRLLPPTTETLPLDIGNMSDFNWTALRKLIQTTGKDVKYKEKKWAKYLLSCRCVYKMPGDWRIVFLEDYLPSYKVPEECVSENPFHKKKR